MNEVGDDQLALQRFVQYIQIKTVQPQPDYQGAFVFLENYARELNLEYSVIATDEDRQAAVLTVGSSLGQSRGYFGGLVVIVVERNIDSAQFAYRCRTGV